MSGHELARKLLAAPDWPVLVIAESDEAPCHYDEVTDVKDVPSKKFSRPDGTVVTQKAIILS